MCVWTMSLNCYASLRFNEIWLEKNVLTQNAKHFTVGKERLWVFMTWYLNA